MIEMKVLCPVCGHRLFITDQRFSLETKCARCGTTINIKGITGELTMHYVTKSEKKVKK